MTKGLEYFANPSNETCTAYQFAAEDYIEYSNSILDCLEADDKDELKEEIQEIETELAALDCA